MCRLQGIRPNPSRESTTRSNVAEKGHDLTTKNPCSVGSRGCGGLRRRCKEVSTNCGSTEDLRKLVGWLAIGACTCRHNPSYTADGRKTFRSNLIRRSASVGAPLRSGTYGYHRTLPRHLGGCPVLAERSCSCLITKFR